MARSLPEGGLTRRWQTTLDLPETDRGSLSTSAPSIGPNGTVVLADSQRVHAVSLRTGDRLWRSDRLPITNVDSPIEYRADTVSPSIDGRGDIYVGTEDGVTALNGSDGSVRWTANGLTTVTTPVVQDETLYALGTDTLVALDRDGSVHWSRSVERTSPPATPAVDGDVLVFTDSNGLEVLDTNTGDRRWQVDLHAETRPVLVDGTCYVGNYEGLHAIDAATGDRRFTFSRGDYRALISPVVTPSSIYVVEQPGEAGAASFALDRTDGSPKPRWCSYVGSGAMTAATDDLTLGMLSIGEGPEEVKGIVAFSAARGETLWAIEGGSFPTEWVTPPAIVEDTIVVATRGGTVAAVSGGG